MARRSYYRVCALPRDDEGPHLRQAKQIDRPVDLLLCSSAALSLGGKGRKEWERPACLPGLVRSGLVCLCLPACLLALSCEHDERGWDRRDLAFSRGRVEIPWFLLARREMRGGWKEVKKGGKGKQVRVERNVFETRCFGGGDEIGVSNIHSGLQVRMLGCNFCFLRNEFRCETIVWPSG